MKYDQTPQRPPEFPRVFRGLDRVWRYIDRVEGQIICVPLEDVKWTS